MPIMDGMEATTKIRQYIYEKGLPQPVIVGCTGNCGEAYTQQGYLAGLNLISGKPIEVDKIK